MELAIPIITKIAKLHRKSNIFAYYTEDDIEQEIWILCLDALKRYIKNRGNLEHYLNTHVSNRLKNLKRDKYYRPDDDISVNSKSRQRMNLINALPINIIKDSTRNRLLASSSSSCVNNPSDILTYYETKKYLEDNIPIDLLSSFNELISGNKIPRSILNKLRIIVVKILKDRESG